MIQATRDMLQSWNLVLMGLTHGPCLFGSFMTRKGVVQSVHPFANSDSFGAFLERIGRKRPLYSEWPGIGVKINELPCPALWRPES